MATGEQFAGLPMEQPIGAPLKEAADASLWLANSAKYHLESAIKDSNGQNLSGQTESGRSV